MTDPTSDVHTAGEQTSGAAAPTIAVRSLRIVRGDLLALTVEHLDLAPGVTTLIGPNGSGKSTLLDAITGLVPCASGSIAIHCSDRRPVSYVLQTQHAATHLLVTAREVVALGCAPELGPFRRLAARHRVRVQEAMERLEVADLARRHVGELSGGQRQRVFVAQGVVQRAPELLLDEPTAGLDMASSLTIRRLIEAERQAGTTVVVATHDLDEAQRADHVVLLNGRVVAAGSPRSVLTPANLRSAYGGRVLDIAGGVVAVDDGVHHNH